MDIKTPSQFGKALKGGEYAWPGGYPTFFATADGEALCFNCAKKEGRQITNAIRDKDRGSGWCVFAQDINWEDCSIYCGHCSKRIPSAYAEDTEGP